MRPLEVDVASRFLGEGCPRKDDVGDLSKVSDQCVLHNQEANALADRVRLDFGSPGVESVGGEVARAEVTSGDSGLNRVKRDHLTLEVLQDQLDPAAVWGTSRRES